ncbi:MAG TPA: glycine zipper 2TM domain-containing protein [Xanthomonadaceae bacterium]|nr:glycine zipper 2TM domain-containing protein [Xanthomonadaceae bacterium]
MNTRLLGACALFAAVAASGCATTSPGYSSSYPYGGSAAPAYGTTASCYDCGTVSRVEVVSAGTSSVPNATGAVVGGIVGGVAGHELSKNSSQGHQNLATVGGAVAGAVAGNAIQNRAQANNTTYNIYVQMDNGTTQVVTQTGLNGIREGSLVRVDNGVATLR